MPLHGGVQFGPEVCVARQRQQPREPRRVGQEDRAPSLIVSGGRFEAARILRSQLGVNGLELGLHLPQRDERQHWLGVLIGTEIAVGPQLVSGRKQRPRKVL